MKTIKRLYCVAVFLFFLSLPILAWGAEPALYMVSADIVAITDEPGMPYERDGNSIPYVDGLKEALIYGNIVKALPVEKGEFAGRYAETFDTEGKSMGYVEMSAFAPLPDYEVFPAPESFRFAVSSPDLFLLPGSLPIVNYTLPESAPFYVLEGEVTEGIGLFKDPKGQEWVLLSFETEGQTGVGLRHAWARANELIRLSQYKPDWGTIISSLVPRDVRGFGHIEDRFYKAILRDGFALDATPLIKTNLVLDDLVESYPEGMFQAVYVPNFITSDLFLHAFHLVYSRALKNIEEINFAPTLEMMLQDALKRLGELEKKAGNDVFVRDTFERTRDFLAVPALLISPDMFFAGKPSARARSELDRIMKAEGILSSPLSANREDYTFYKPRGHYTSSETLSRYFRAMVFLGGMPIRLETGDSEEDRKNTALIALLCLIFDDKKLSTQWESIYNPLTDMIGQADDPSLKNFVPLVRKIIKGPEKMADVNVIAELHQAFIAVAPKPLLVDRVGSRNSMPQEEREREALGFRFMGRRFVLDAWIVSRLTSPNVGSDREPRNLPRAEDVMAALGSLAAESVLSADKENIPHYAEALAKVKESVYSFLKEDRTERRNVVHDWLGSFALFFADKESKQFFWNSPRWEYKKLLTASASWAELKHDTVLYSKQSYAEMGGGGEWEVEPFRKPLPRGYVEPSPQLFQSLFNALDRMRDAIARYNLGDRDGESSWHGVRSKIEAFREHVIVFRDIADKEVRNEALSKEDYLAISQVTAYLNGNLLLDSDVVDASDAEQLRMALVSDIATDAQEGRVLQVATGTPRRIYVFVDDVHSGPRVTIGYTYSFYSFERSLQKGRMTNEEWRSLVYDEKRQNELGKLEPTWLKELMVR